MSEKQEEKEFTLPRRRFTVEFWVGLFTLIGSGCFAYLAINIAGMRLTNAGFYQVTAVFTNVSGLTVGAPVEIAGVPVGEVSDLVLEETEAKVTLQIRNEVKLRDDDIALIRTKGIIGDRYLKISPGGAEEFIPQGGQIDDTESAVEFEEIIGKFIHSLSDDDDEK